MASLSTGRLLTEVGLRLIGLWYVFAAIESLVNSVSYLFYGYLGPAPFNFNVVASVVAVVVALAQFAIALVIIRWAPKIAARFYRAEAHLHDLRLAIGPGDIYHTACFMLGTYCLIQGATFGVMALAYYKSAYQGMPIQYSGAAVLVYSASGLLLIFGARPIAEFIGRIRHDPNSIPNQQFSLKMLLIVTGIVAVILGVARMMSMR